MAGGSWEMHPTSSVPAQWGCFRRHNPSPGGVPYEHRYEVVACQGAMNLVEGERTRVADAAVVAGIEVTTPMGVGAALSSPHGIAFIRA